MTLVAKRYNIPRRNLLRWQKYGCERKEGGGRGADEDMEKILVGKIKMGELTDEKQVREAAAKLSRVPGFKASKGWFCNFCTKHGVGWQESVGGKQSPCYFESRDCLAK